MNVKIGVAKPLWVCVRVDLVSIIKIEQLPRSGYEKQEEEEIVSERLDLEELLRLLLPARSRFSQLSGFFF